MVLKGFGFFCFLFFERETVGDGQRERERENPKHAPHSMLSLTGEGGAGGLSPPEPNIKSRSLNGLSRPRRPSSVVLIHILLTADDGEHFSTCLFAICVSRLKCLLKAFVHL